MSAQLVLECLYGSKLLKLKESTRVQPSPAVADALGCTLVKLSPDQLLVHAGDCSERAYIVAAGTVTAHNAKGLVHTFKKGDALSMRSLLFPHESVAVTLIAGEEGAQLLAVSSSQFERVFEDAFTTVAGIARGRCVRAKATPRTMDLDVDVAEFKGIRFATARRYQLPVLVEPNGTRDALAFAHTCPQPVVGLFDGIAPVTYMRTNAPELFFADKANPRPFVESSEDCLNLNIYAPLQRSAHGYPVMVWIHGGGFEIGAGSEPQYDGRRLAGKGVVLVTINYRLGVLGFLAGVDGAVPNVGLHDQVAALRWVKKHIGRFGGDANNVTVFGESAGAASVASLLGTRVRRDEGLFQKAIPMSGAASWVLSQRDAFKVRDAFAALLGVPKLALDVLNGMSANELVAQGGKFNLIGLNKEAVQMREALHGRMMAWQPCCLESSPASVEPLFGGLHPLVAVARGIASDVALMTGVMDTEFALFMMNPFWRKPFVAANRDLLPTSRIKALLTDTVVQWTTNDYTQRPVADAKRLAEVLVDFYVGNPAEVSNDTLERVVERLHSVWMFDLTVQRLVTAHARAAGKQHSTFAYRVTFPSAMEQLKVPHALDLPLVFGTLDSAIGVLAGDTPESRNVSRAMMRAWTAFAKTGSPGFKAVDEGHVHVFGPAEGRGECTLFQSTKEAAVWNVFARNAELSPEYFDAKL